MTFAFTQDVPIDAAFYRRIMAGVGPEVPEGLILHLATEHPDGGLRYFDVWDSEADLDRFVSERLHPVVHDLLREVFGEELPPEPDRTTWPVVHLWEPTA